jgi:S1-C subfamily serine protease
MKKNKKKELNSKDSKGKKSKSPSSKKAPKSLAPQSSKVQLLKAVGIFSLVAGVIGIAALGVIIVLNKRSSENTENIKIEDVNPETAEKLTSQLVYSADAEELEYYSPTIDTAITYSTNSFTVSEGYKSLTIMPKQEDFTIYANLTAGEKEDDTNPLQKKTEYYNDVFKEASVSETTEVSENITETIIQYNKISITDETEEKVTHTLLYMEKDNNYVLLDITELGDKETTEEYKESYIEIMKSARIKPDDIEKEIIVQLPVSNTSISIDRRKWEIINQNENSIYVNYISSDEGQSDWVPTSLYIYSYNTSQEIKESNLKEMLKSDLDNTKERYTEDRLEILETEKSETLGGLEFYYNKYLSREKWEEANNQVTKNYYSYNPATKSVINIKVKYPKNKEDYQNELQKVLETLEIDTVQSEEEKEAQIHFEGDKAVLGTSTVEIEKATLLTKSAVVRIFNRSCTTVKIGSDSGLPYSAGKSYNVCLAGFGSGFYINEEGNVVTNAHVAAPNPLDIAADGMFYGYDQNNLLSDLTMDTVTILNNVNPELIAQADINDPDFQNLLVESIFTLLVEGHREGHIEFSNTEYANYLQGNDPFMIDQYTIDLKQQDNHTATNLTYSEEIDSTTAMQLDKVRGKETGIDKPDIAILEPREGIRKPRIAIKLSDPASIDSGQSVFVLGFPGAANNSEIFSAEATNIPTITKGTISAIKPNASDKFDLIQIDASISSGNSGGPIVNEQGETVGVATYGINTGQSADFNVGISVKELASILSDNGINTDQGVLTRNFSAGIDNFSKEYYKWAVEDFEEVKATNADLAEIVNPLIDIAKDKIKKGQDNTPLLSVADVNIHKGEAMIGALVIVLLLMGVLILVLIKTLARNRRTPSSQKEPKPPDTPINPGSGSTQDTTSAPAQPKKPEPTSTVPTLTQASNKQTVSTTTSDPSQTIPTTTEQVAPSPNTQGAATQSQSDQSPTAPADQTNTQNQYNVATPADDQQSTQPPTPTQDNSSRSVDQSNENNQTNPNPIAGNNLIGTPLQQNNSSQDQPTLNASTSTQSEFTQQSQSSQDQHTQQPSGTNQVQATAAELSSNSDTQTQQPIPQTQSNPAPNIQTQSNTQAQTQTENQPAQPPAASDSELQAQNNLTSQGVGGLAQTPAKNPMTAAAGQQQVSSPATNQPSADQPAQSISQQAPKVGRPIKQRVYEKQPQEQSTQNQVPQNQQSADLDSAIQGQGAQQSAQATQQSSPTQSADNNASDTESGSNPIQSIQTSGQNLRIPNSGN